MMNGIKFFLFSGLILLTGCFSTDTGYPVAWLAESDGETYLLVNHRRSRNPSTFKLYRLDTPAQTSPEFFGDVVGVMGAFAAAGDKGLTIIFADGMIGVYDPATRTLGEKNPPSAAMRLLTASQVNATTLWAIGVDHQENAALLTWQAANKNAATWTPTAITLPFNEIPTCLEITDKQVLGWRMGSPPLAGLWLAQFKATPEFNQWDFLPSPPHNFYSGIFAMCPYENGFLLAQEVAAEEKISLLKFSADQWTQLSPLKFAPEILASPAYSLAILQGKNGLFAVRTDENGVHLLTAPHFPDDFAQPHPSPVDEAQNNNSWRRWWWIFTGALLFFVILQRWTFPRVAAAKTTSPAAQAFSEAYKEALKIAARLQIGGIASVFDRALAMMVDGAIALALPYSYLKFTAATPNWREHLGTLTMFFMWLSGMVIYTTLSEIFFGCTLGKALFRLRVRSADGGRATAGQIVIRNLLRFVDFFPFTFFGVSLWYLVAAVTATFTRRTQRVGDLIAGTVVRYHFPLRRRKIVLASASAQRQILLKMLALDFTVQPAKTVETIIGGIAPPEMALRIAEEKAMTVANNADDMALIIGADTMVVVDNEILGKPADAAAARAMLKKLSGKKHLVITAVVILDNATGQHIADCAATEILWRELSDAEITAYLATNEWQHRAGAYAIQGEASKFTLVIQGSLSNVIGLPLELLRDMFADLDA